MNVITTARQHQRARELLRTDCSDQRVSKYFAVATTFYDTRRTTLKLVCTAINLAAVAVGVYFLRAFGTTIGNLTIEILSVFAVAAANTYIVWNRSPAADLKRIRTTVGAAQRNC